MIGLAVADQTGVQLRTGSDVTSAQPVGSFGTSNSIEALAVGDLGDAGLDDIVVADGANGVGVLKNQGGTFPTLSPVWAGGVSPAPISVTLGRFSAGGAGPLEVAVLYANGTSELLKLGGAGSTLAVDRAGPTFANTSNTLVTGFFNNASASPWLVAGNTATRKKVELSDSSNGLTSTFTAPSSMMAFFPDVVAVGDVDHDGAADVVVGSDTGPYSVMWIPGSGAGSFTGAQTLGSRVFTDVRALAVADLDGDGNSDVLIGYQTGLTVYFSGSASFVDETSLADVDSIAVGDFDGNGVPDIAIGSRSTPNLQVIIGECL